MNSIKVTTCITGMDALDDAMRQAKEAADRLDDAVVAVKRAMRGLGLTVEQPPADAEG